MTPNATLTVNGRVLPIDGEKNLLELIRKADIEIPTFCYHSELSVYGACRLCLVDIEGRGLVSSCSTLPAAGLVVQTNTAEIRNMRRTILELLLANGHENCTTCPKNGACALQNLARKLGVRQIRFKPRDEKAPLDETSPSLVRDPNKCVLCGDCVRYCREIQGIGAIDFARRGSDTMVSPAFNKGLGCVECVNCGQCAAVCPTGSITPKSEVEAVWADIGDKSKYLVAQIAPAVRVALGEQFGMKPGDVTTGQIVAALKMLGFDKVFDTSFAADLTVVEEASEFMARKMRGENLPQFTSCCPGWVKFAEQYYPELLSNLSTCRSPQQMFGSVAREILPTQTGTGGQEQELVIVSIMPCTAKKYEAKMEKFSDASGRPDVNHVLTTQELVQLIEEAGIRFAELSPESLDMPLGFKTGAGVIFGASGGVSEAVLRYAAEKLGSVRIDGLEFKSVRGEGGLREATINVGGTELKLAVVHGLRRARIVAEQVRKCQCKYDLVEVMACPGGCIGGAGQPVTGDAAAARTARARGLYEADKTLQLHKSQDNHYVTELYETCLGEVGGHKAHKLLHTAYQSRRRIEGQDLDFSTVTATPEPLLEVEVCVGTNCYVKGSQNLLNQLIRHVEQRGLTGQVAVQGTFCLERCGKGPNVRIGGEIIEHCSVEKAIAVIEAELAKAGV